MRKKRGLSVIALVLFISFFFVHADAQEIISPEKRVLIKELVGIMEIEKQFNHFKNTTFLQIEKNYAYILSQSIPEMGRSVKVSSDKLFESKNRFLKRFKELYSERINFDEIIEQVYHSLYNRYFTEKELSALIVFYKSPPGKKLLEVMPQLTYEAMQQSNELLNPQVMAIMQDILREEKKFLLKEESTRLE